MPSRKAATETSNSVPSGATRTITFDLGETKYIYGLRVYANHEDTDEIKMYYSSDGSSWNYLHVFSQSEVNNGTAVDVAGLGRYVKYEYKNTAGSAANHPIYEISIFTKGTPSSGEWVYPAQEYTAKTISLPYDYNEWIWINDYPTVEDWYYIFLIEPDGGVRINYATSYSIGYNLVETSIENVYDTVNSGTLWFNIGYHYDKVRAEASNSTSISNYGKIPFKYRNQNIITYALAKMIADWLSTEYSAPNSYCEIEVEGINGLSLKDKVQVSLHSLSNSSGDLLNVEYNINSYEHEVINNRWRTYLELGRPSKKVYQIIAQLNKAINTA